MAKLRMIVSLHIILWGLTTSPNTLNRKRDPVIPAKHKLGIRVIPTQSWLLWNVLI